jgi:hypothetical protein
MIAAPTLVVSDEQRQLCVDRRWPRHQWDAQGRSRWAGWGWRNYLYVAICGLLISSTVLEIALSKDGEKEPWWPFGLLAESPAGLVILAALILLNGWLIDRSLSDKTPIEAALPLWLRGLRRIAVSVPILGLYAIPVWRWIVRTSPAWAFRTSTFPRLALFFPSSGLPRPLTSFLSRADRLRRTSGQSFPRLALWCVAGQIAPWLALLSWLTTAESLSPARRGALLALDGLFHILACLLALQYSAIRKRPIRTQRWRVSVARYAPLLLLPPFPFFILGLFTWIASIGEGREEETLMETIHDRKSLPPRRASPRPKLAERLSRTQRTLRGARDEIASILEPFLGSRESGEILHRRFAFFRLKTFLLLLEAGALAWLCARLGRPLFSLDTFPFAQMAPWLILAAAGVIVEVPFLVMRVVGWFQRDRSSYHPYGRSLIFTQLALPAGLLLGTLLAVDKTEGTLGLLLIVIGLGSAIASTLLFGPISFLLLLPGRQTAVILAWAALFFELFVVGAVMYYHPDLAPPFMNLLKAAVALSPVFSLMLFFGLNGWLLHPFSLRHLFEKRLPGRTRTALAAVCLTAVLPLGGIAIPFWIYAHHRLWPRYEPLLWELQQSDLKRRP